MKDVRGITLVEVLVAISLFAVVVTVSSSILIEVVKLQKKSEIQNVIYEDSQLILQQITNEIQRGTIDFEEYYSRNVVAPLTGLDYYGLNYGVYSSRFYNPGLSLAGPTSNPTDLGVECSYPPADAGVSPPPSTCEVEYTLSEDRNTGLNPSNGLLDANAFCDQGSGSCVVPVNEVSELYLIDSTGTRKTIIAPRTGLEEPDTVLGLMRMEGLDIDQNGVVDTFVCDEDYTCFGDQPSEQTALAGQLSYLPFITDETDIVEFGITLPSAVDLGFSPPGSDTWALPLEFASSQFIPISPLRSSLLDLKFIINPVDDPYRAYGEPAVQTHPTVTIIMTLGLSAATDRDYPGDFNPITVQTTVAAGVVGKVNAYPPMTDLSWLSGLGIPVTP